MIPSPIFCDICGASNQPQASFCCTCGRPLPIAHAPSRNTSTGRLLSNHLLKQRYRILDAAGKGGMGAVYKAEDTQLGNRKVAVKEMSQSGLSPQEAMVAVDAFKQEAHILAGLQHPNLPNIHDHFSEAGHWYLVMSFIQGETMQDYLNSTKGGKLPVEEVLHVGIQLCTVLDYLHTQQPPIIFRDLKPSNIMRTKDRHLYLIDFGIARHFKPGQAKDTAAYGSMGYASPEQYGNAQTTPRSDIYSLGAVLHQLLSGHHPSMTPFRLPSLQPQVPTIPFELVTLIMQMLELDESKRPTDISVVKLTLQNILLALHSQVSPPALLLGGVGKAGASTTLGVGKSPTPPIILSRSSAGTKIHRRPLLMGIVGGIIVGGGLASFVFSRQVLSGNNAGQRQAAIPTQPALSTPPPVTPTSSPSTAYPHLAPTYQGTVHNLEVNTTATLILTSIVQNQQAISGNVIIGPELAGDGPFTGTIEKDGAVNFTDTPSDGSYTSIIFSGSMHTDGSLSGTYTVAGTSQKGTWQAASS